MSRKNLIVLITAVLLLASCVKNKIEPNINTGKKNKDFKIKTESETKNKIKEDAKDESKKRRQ